LDQLAASVGVHFSADGDLDDLCKSLDCYDATSDITPLPKEAPVQDEDAAENLLSILSLSGRPTISEEEEERELATLTNEERADVLSDMFGEKCTLGTRPEKRAKRDLDADSILFLVGQMRLELERIPKEEKQALLEAQLKSHPDELSNQRLTTFLRCEGMNAKVRSFMAGFFAAAPFAVDKQRHSTYHCSFFTFVANASLPRSAL
jgi:hypothetical protein